MQVATRVSRLTIYRKFRGTIDIMKQNIQERQLIVYLPFDFKFYGGDQVIETLQKIVMNFVETETTQQTLTKRSTAHRALQDFL